MPDIHSENEKQGFLVYPKYPYCILIYLREAAPMKVEKDAIRVHQKALFWVLQHIDFLPISCYTGLTVVKLLLNPLGIETH